MEIVSYAERRALQAGLLAGGGREREREMRGERP